MSGSQRMPQELSTNPAPDLRAYLAVLRHRKWVIIALSALMVVATVAFTSRQTPVYTSMARVQVNPVGPQCPYCPQGTVDINTEQGVANSATVATLAKDNLHLSGTPQAILGALSVSIETDTDILDFSYSDPSPSTAAKMAEAFATAYLQNREAVAQQNIADQRKPLDGEVKALSLQIKQLDAQLVRTRDPGQIATIQQNLASANGRYGALKQQLLPFDMAYVKGGAVVSPAVTPTSPSSPNWLVNVGLAVIVGLLLGVGIAFLQERLDERLRGGRDLEEIIGAPILAAVPKVEGWRRRDTTRIPAVDNPKGAVAEAFRTLRTNLEYAGRDGGLRVIGVTSPLMGEGKTATAANLAATLAQTGKRVIAVSCDLRKPRLHRFFELDNSVGVSSILLGKASLAQAAQRPSVDTLRVLASGPVPSNPAELLGSTAMDELLAELRMFADYIILDTPPVLAVADALVLAPKVDGVVVLADAASTNRGAAQHTREQLEQAGARIVGCILNNVDPNKARYYPHNYGYYATYGYRTEKDTPQPSGNGHKEESMSVEDMWK